jgi:hypothetical protein
MATISVTSRDLRNTESYLNKLAKQADNNPKTGMLNSKEVKEKLGTGTAAFSKLVLAAQHRQAAIDGLPQGKKASLVELDVFASQLHGAVSSATKFADTKSRDGISDGNGKIEGNEVAKLDAKSQSAAAVVRLAWALKEAGEI